MSLVVAIFTAPINFVVDFLFVDILSSPTADETKMKAFVRANGNMGQRAARRASNIIRRASALSQDSGKQASLMKSQSSSLLQLPIGVADVRLLATSSASHLVEQNRESIDGMTRRRTEMRKGPLLTSKERMRMRLKIQHKANSDSADDLFSEFLIDLNEQRRLLKPAEKERYDLKWG
jgi:hypothetical protein